MTNPRTEPAINELKARQKWNSDEQLRADFDNDFERYKNYLKEDKGIKIKTISTVE